MTARPSNPGDPTPPPFNEEHMLEWVEGRLSRIEEANRAAATRSGVSDRVRQMQANRRALQSLGEERAPAELMDRVLAALERDALLGLSNGEDLSDHPPISIATHTAATRRPGLLHKWAPQLALAAGLLLLVGGAAYWGSVLVKPGAQPGPIATNDTSPVTGPTDKPTPGDQGARVAMAEASPEAMTTLAAPDAAAALQALPPESPDARVLRLAREGRLVIRVKAQDLSRLAQVEALDTLKDGRTWRISRDVPNDVVAAVTPPDRMPVSTQPDETAFASVAPLVASGTVGFPVLPQFPRVEPRTYLIDFPDTQRNLAAIKSTLSERLKATVEFEELEQPIQLPRVEDSESLLWWTLPPSSWTQRVTVPVVVR